MPTGWAPARHSLIPLYSRRVVAGGEHRARVAEVAGGEVQPVGRGQPDVDHVGAGVRGARGERVGEAGRAGPHVVADDDGLGPDHLDEGGAGAARELLVDLVGHGAADVVGLEDRADGRGIQAGHARDPRPGHSGPSSVGGEHPEVTLAGDLATGLRGRGRDGDGDGSRRLADGVRQGEQVVGGGSARPRVGCEPEHVPAAGGAEPLGVGLAQVVGVRLRVGRQRARGPRSGRRTRR